MAELHTLPAFDQPKLDVITDRVTKAALQAAWELDALAVSRLDRLGLDMRFNTEAEYLQALLDRSMFLRIRDLARVLMSAVDYEGDDPGILESMLLGNTAPMESDAAEPARAAP